MSTEENGRILQNDTRQPRAEFAPRDLDPDAVGRVRLAFSACLDAVERDVPPSRERSLVLTKMQEACMWAVRGVPSKEA